MAKRQVTVVINGEETVSEATDKAGGALGGLSSKIPGWTKSLALVTLAYQAVKTAISAATDYVLDSFAAYDRFAGTQARLAAQSKLTGIAQAELEAAMQGARREFGLSEEVAANAAITTGKYASRAGDATRQNQLLASALNLGAAAGLSAAETMEALEQGLRGQDEGFDKLLGKNPSSIWKEYADANGLAVGKMTDTQKRMAELTAIIEAGNLVGGTYNERLETGAGKTEKLTQAIDEQKKEFGRALQPLRIFIVQGLTTLVEFGGRVALAFARVANAIGVVFTGAIEAGRSVVGGFAVALGKLTGNKELEDWGRVQANAFSDFQAQLKKLEEKYLTTGKAAGESATQQDAAVKKVGGAVKDTVETTEQQVDRLNKAIDAKLGKPMEVAIGLTEGAIAKLGQAAQDQLPTDQSQKFLTHMQGLVVQAGEAREKMLGLGDNTKKASDSTKDTARDIERVARSALDAAVAFGVIDKAAANTLNSVINIASGIAGVVSGDVTSGVAAILTGITNVVASMLGGDAERKRLLGQNNAALSKLSRDIGALKLNITGEDFAKAQSALGSVVGNLRGGRGAANENDVRNALYAQGLTMEDLDRIAKEFGIEVRTKSGALNVDSVRALFDALGMASPGRVGQSFGDQLSFFQEGQRLDNATGPGAIQGLLDFLRNVGGVTALEGLNADDPQALRAALRNLVTQMNSGKGVQGLGKLTGSQFMDLLVGIIGDLDNLGSGSGAGASGGDITVPTGGGGGGTVSAPTETIQAVIGTMNTNIGTILTGHTAIHERIAVATEGSLMRLTSIDNKMDNLIAVTAGQIDATDAKLEAMRRMAALERGERPVLG
jgi:hypothetical protein